MTTKTTTTATPSIAPPPLLRHLVRVVDDNWPKDRPVVNPEDRKVQQTALCGFVWDTFGLKPNGDVCAACLDEFIRHHGFPHALDRRPR